MPSGLRSKPGPLNPDFLLEDRLEDVGPVGDDAVDPHRYQLDHFSKNRMKLICS